MDTQLKFSDIIRYILLGCISMLVVTVAFVLYDSYCTGSTYNLPFWVTTLNAYMESYSSSLTIVAVVAIASFYFVGLIVQGIRMMFCQILYYFKDNRFMSFLFGDCNNFPQWSALVAFLTRTFVFSPVFFYEINVYCRVLKFRNHTSSGYPKWLNISNHPEELCEIIEGAINSGKYRDDDRRYLNELLIGILTVIRITMWTFIVMSLFALPQVETASKILILALICMFAGAIVTMIAKAYASEYIKSLGTSITARCNDSQVKERFNKMLAANGTPRVFLLVRTCSKNAPMYERNLKRTLDSINRQTYQNILVIVLEDVDKDYDNQVTTAKQIISLYQDSQNYPFLFDKIAYSVEHCGGPAAAMIRIKELFLKTACDDDIAVMLDDDDALKRSDAIEDIVYMMNSRKANICITSFESCGEISMDITNKGGGKHNELVNILSKKRAGHFTPDLCYASSIGWTKAFKHETAKTMHYLLTKYADEYRCLERYEDFPDFIAFLFSKSRVCGVPKPTHLYYKDKGRITTTKNIEDFKVARVGFLALLLKMVVENPNLFDNVFKAETHAIEFIVFKTCQIEGIMAKFSKEANEKKASGKKLDEGENDFIGMVPGTFTKWLYEKIHAENLDTTITRHLHDVTSCDSFIRYVSEKKKEFILKNILSSK